MTNPKPQVEWCNYHSKHEEIHACEPDLENYAFDEETDNPDECPNCLLPTHKYGCWPI